MQANELKALLQKTKEVAVYPAHIETDLPYYMTTRGKWGRVCPGGLVKATVIEDGYEWVEKRPLSPCGDRDYEIQRRNGVLVEFSLEDDSLLVPDPHSFPHQQRADQISIVGKKVYRKTNGKRVGVPFKHTEALTREGKKYVRMIVSRKAIFAAWDEYYMIEAQRQKNEAEQIERMNKLHRPQAELMGVSLEELHEMHRRHFGIYLQADYVDTYKRDPKSDEDIHTGKVGRLMITLDQAEKILNMLTPTQKAKLKATK